MPQHARADDGGTGHTVTPGQQVPPEIAGDGLDLGEFGHGARGWCGARGRVK
jgi:hypothetical protein